MTIIWVILLEVAFTGFLAFVVYLYTFIRSFRLECRLPRSQQPGNRDLILVALKLRKIEEL